MAAGVKNISIEQGAKHIMKLTLKDKNAVVINITGMVFDGSMKRTASNKDTVLATWEFSASAPNLPTVLPADGQIYAILTDEATSALPISGVTYLNTTDLAYEIGVTDAGGFRTRLLNGKATVSPEA